MHSTASGVFSWKGVVATCSVIGLITPLLQIAMGGLPAVSELLVSAVAGLVFSNSIGLLATTIAFLVWPKLSGRSRLVQIMVMVAILLVSGIVGSLLACAILTATGIFSVGHFWPTYWRTLRFALFITFTFGIGSWAFEELRTKLQQTTLQLRTDQFERERAEKLAAEARLSSLESRIHPHFLFNALNSIASLVREDPALAERLIERMAALLRFSLDSTRVSLVPVSQELRVIEDYLEIEQVRFGGRLRYSLELRGEIGSAAIPPMSVQTLVENSLKYAVAPRPEGGQVQVCVFAEGESTTVEVWDDGPGFSLETAPPGHGLDNLRSRLEALFGAGARLTVGRRQGGTSVMVSVPLNRAVAVA